MWRSLSIPSLLLDRTDHALRRFDRRLRCSLLLGFQDRFDHLVTGKSYGSIDSRSLAMIYRAVVASNQGNPECAISDLYTALEMAVAPHLKARALQALVEILEACSAIERARGNQDLSDKHERDCRDLCAVGFEKFSGYQWSRSLTYALHAVMGALDYYQGDVVSAKIHLLKAIEEHGLVKSEFEKHETYCIGLAHLYLGDLFKREKNFDRAREHYEEARTQLRDDRVEKSEVLGRLAGLTLDRGGNSRHAMRLAKRALRNLRSSEVRPGLIDELKCYVAWAHYNLGNEKEAERIFSAVSIGAEDEGIKKQLRIWLERRQSKVK